jgi:hypothetical protein
MSASATSVRPRPNECERAFALVREARDLIEVVVERREVHRGGVEALVERSTSDSFTACCHLPEGENLVIGAVFSISLDA